PPGFPTPTFLPIPVSSTPFGSTGGSGVFSGGPVPEASEIILRDADGNIQRANGEQLATGRVFDVGPQGQLAFQAFDNNLYVGGVLLTISPASEFGLKGRVDYIDYAPSGGRVAFTYRNPEAEVDNGVWVFNMSANTSQQIFRDTDRRAGTVLFSPDSSVVLIRIVNGAGQPAGLTFLPVTWAANTDYRYHPYPYSTWSPNGTSVIVSGPIDGGGPSVLGRVNLDAEQTFVQYDFSSAGVSYTAAATELSNGQLAFLGGPGAAGPHRLFIMPIGGQASVVSGEVPGTIESWEWNRARNAILLITNNGGTREVWIVQTDGATRNITSTTGAPRTIRW
ncbi:MAG: hypothetical protein L0154_15640, partial [Chloroflexi bacterium]|nr:hypothetical protein [Chloroflexota bacterium]